MGFLNTVCKTYCVFIGIVLTRQIYPNPLSLQSPFETSTLSPEIYTSHPLYHLEGTLFTITRDEPRSTSWFLDNPIRSVLHLSFTDLHSSVVLHHQFSCPRLRLDRPQFRVKMVNDLGRDLLFLLLSFAGTNIPRFVIEVRTLYYLQSVITLV